MIHFMKSHAKNTHTTSMIMKRDFTLNDIYFLYRHLLENTTLRHLHLSFVEAGVENNSNFLNPNTCLNRGIKGSRKKDPQILVPSDRMEVTTTIHQPLSMFAHNATIESKTLLISLK